jgi:hypothetical protein
MLDVISIKARETSPSKSLRDSPCATKQIECAECEWLNGAVGRSDIMGILTNQR